MHQNTNRNSLNNLGAIDSRIDMPAPRGNSRPARYNLGTVSSADVRRGRIRQAKIVGGTAAVAGLAYLGYGTEFINIGGAEDNVQDHLDNVPGAQAVYDDFVHDTLPEDPNQAVVEIEDQP